jgi:hypothetical protein
MHFGLVIVRKSTILNNDSNHFHIQSQVVVFVAVAVFVPINHVLDIRCEFDVMNYFNIL